MARTPQRTPAALLERARDALARASRCREVLELQHADVAYRQALNYIEQYDQPDEPKEDTSDLRQTVEAERLLVEAVLNAHKRTYEENITHFEAALRVARAIGSKIQAARVLCCGGCVLIFEGLPRHAIDLFDKAEAELENMTTAANELSQIQYHRARALIADNRHNEALALLERLTLPNDGMGSKLPPTRYDLAVMALLAGQYQRLWRFGDARHMARYALGVAHRSGLQTTREALQLRFMARWWQPWSYLYWLKRADVPEF